jgi:hypothetical protein
MRSILRRHARRAAAGLFCAATLASPAAAMPDFAGLWGRNAFNFEPLATGPQPVTNLERLPDGTGNPSKLVGDYTNPILKPEAAQIVKRLGDMARTGVAHPDPSNQCRPYAPPFTFAMELGLQLVQAKDHVTILYNQDDQVRRVWLNRGHPAQVVPSPMGDSVGHYEGDTLVVDTVGVAVEPEALAMVDRYGTPRSPSLHVVERYRLIDGDAAKLAAERQIRQDGPMGLAGAVLVDPKYPGPGLQLDFTVEDPNVFTMPWSARITYRRIIGPWLEQICADSRIDYEEGHAPLMPVAQKPDF